jgi:hypothetical protein
MMHTVDHPAAEPLAYLGTGIVLFFAALGVAMAWDGMSAVTQVLVLGAAALVLVVVSLATPIAPVGAGRVADTAATTAAVLAGWAAGLFAHSAGVVMEQALAIGAIVGAVAAGAAHLRRRGALPHVVAGTGLIGAATWLAVDLDVSVGSVSVVVLVLGLLWWGLGVGGFVEPTRAAMVGGAVHIFAGAAGTLADEASWPLLAVIVGGLFLAYASMQGIEPVINRSFAVAVGVVGVAKLGLLIEDPVLRIIVAGIAVGVALVTAGSMLFRRRSAPDGPSVAGDAT